MFKYDEQPRNGMRDGIECWDAPKGNWEGPVRFIPGGEGVDDNIPGVYIIAECIGDVLLARYVGKGSPISDRISVHGNINEENEKLRNLFQNRKMSIRYYYMQILTETEREDIEHTAFLHYEKSVNLYNENTPKGTEIPGVIFPF